MNNPIQTILRFVEDSCDELVKFQHFWLDMSARSPDAFPLEMAAGEWHEQFIAWLESKPEV